MVKNIGPLEREILEILWIKKESSARDICSKIEESGERRAYSTIRTIINRLVEKKIKDIQIYSHLIRCLRRIILINTVNLIPR